LPQRSGPRFPARFPARFRKRRCLRSPPSGRLTVVARILLALLALLALLSLLYTTNWKQYPYRIMPRLSTWLRAAQPTLPRALRRKHRQKAALLPL